MLHWLINALLQCTNVQHIHTVFHARSFGAQANLDRLYFSLGVKRFHAGKVIQFFCFRAIQLLLGNGTFQHCRKYVGGSRTYLSFVVFHSRGCRCISPTTNSDRSSACVATTSPDSRSGVRCNSRSNSDFGERTCCRAVAENRLMCIICCIFRSFCLSLVLCHLEVSSVIQRYC